MPTLSQHIIGVNEAYRDISEILNDLSHNKFMLDLEKPPTFGGEPIQCIECKVMKDSSKFQRVFFQRGEGICKDCWSYDSTWDVKEE